MSTILQATRKKSLSNHPSTSILNNTCILFSSHTFGLDSNKHYNLHLLDENTLLFSSANTYQILNFKTNELKIFYGTDVGGVGSVCVHPSKKYFAVAEKGKLPLIFIYEYPSLKLYRILRKGAEISYYNVEFNHTGDKLASISGAPDYILSIWDWMQEKVMLKCKAFSQDIYRVEFSPFAPGNLITSGTGHIRFWKMATTFTGLKLQGEIAKFGALELSDVYGFAEFADAKVVSGTEYGTLILWEGNLVKAHIKRKNGPLHNGVINVVINSKGNIITAGSDGYIRWWAGEPIDNAEPDETIDFYVEPIKEQLVEYNGAPASIIFMIPLENKWLIENSNGSILLVTEDSKDAKLIYTFHGGFITSIALNHKSNALASVANDGMVRIWDLVNRKEIANHNFKVVAKSIDWMPTNTTNQGKIIAIGFSDGTVRVCTIGDSKIKVVFSTKAHDTEVRRIKYSPDGKFLVVSSKDELFYFEAKSLNEYEPLCLYAPGSKINDSCWNKDSTKYLICMENGAVHEIDRPSSIDNSKTYMFNLNRTEWKMRMMESQMSKNRKKEEVEDEATRRKRLINAGQTVYNTAKKVEEEEKEWDAAPITSCSYVNNRQFLIAVEGLFKGLIYLCETKHVRPLKAIEIPKNYNPSILQCSLNDDIIAIGFTNGKIQLMNFENPSKYVELHDHDMDVGLVTNVAFNEYNTLIVSASNDGTIFINKLCKNFKDMKDDTTQPKFQEMEKEQTTKALNLKEELVVVEVSGVIQKDQMSLQQAKLREEADRKSVDANSKKKDMLKRISLLRDKYNAFVTINKKVPQYVKLSIDEIGIETNYFSLLKNKCELELNDVKKEVGYGIEVAKVGYNKFKQQFIDPLEFSNIAVRGIASEEYVRTIRLEKLREAVINYKKNTQMNKEEKPENENKELNESMERGSPTSNKSSNFLTKKLELINKDTLAAKESIIKPTKIDPNNKREIVKEQRLIKKAKLMELKQMKQVRSQEDQEKQIKEAILSIGDYKLKISPNYVVPSTTTINEGSKKAEIMLIVDSIHSFKKTFNTDCLFLKKERETIVQKIAQINKQLKSINEVLNEKDEPFEPPEDIPNELAKLENVSEKDIKEYIRLKAKQEREAKAKKNVFAEKKKEENEEVIESNNDDGKNKKEEELNTVERANKRVQESALQNEIKEMNKIKLKCDKVYLLKEREMIIKEFDKNLTDLRDFRIQTLSSMNETENKVIRNYQELMYLSNVEEKDVMLNNQMKEFKQNEKSIMVEIEEVGRKLKEKQTDIVKYNEERKVKLKQFKEAVTAVYSSKESEEYKLLYRYYRRRIKQKKEEEIKEDNDEDSQEEKSNESQEEDDEEINIPDETDSEVNEEENKQLNEEEAGDEEEYINRKITDENLMKKIEGLREERHDKIEQLIKATKISRTYEKQINEKNDKLKSLKEELYRLHKEILIFQREKMTELNKIPVSVLLHTSQIQNLEKDENAYNKFKELDLKKSIEPTSQVSEEPNSQTKKPQESPAKYTYANYKGYYMPTDISDSILFCAEEYELLKKRFYNLSEVCNKKDNEMKELISKITSIKSQNDLLEKKKAKKINKYKEDCAVRFGQDVDLDKVVQVEESEIVKKLKLNLYNAEKAGLGKERIATDELLKAKKRLQEAIEKNTGLLNSITELGNAKFDLQKKIDTTKKQVFKFENADKKTELQKEKDKIKEVLELQTERINVLKREIEMFRKKGGHIYTTVTSNRRVNPTN